MARLSIPENREEAQVSSSQATPTCRACTLRFHFPPEELGTSHTFSFLSQGRTFTIVQLRLNPQEPTTSLLVLHSNRSDRAVESIWVLESRVDNGSMVQSPVIGQNDPGNRG